MMPLKEITFPMPWGIIAAKAWGDPCASPVLMLHGIQDNAGTFDNILPYLPRAFYYVAIDLPGHGMSSRFPKGSRLDFMEYLFSVNRVVKQLQWKKFILIGHSLGGQLSQYYAATFPDKVEKIISLDAIGPNSFKMEDYTTLLRDWHEEVMKLEEKILNADPPGYTKEEALNKLVENRRSVISKEAAAKLLPRSIKKGKNGYYFSADQRLKLTVSIPVTAEQHATNYSKISAEFLLVLTHDLYNIGMARGYVHSSIIEAFKKNPLFKLVLIDGTHDVHSMEPEKVGAIVSEFMLKHKSKL